MCPLVAIIYQKLPAIRTALQVVSVCVKGIWPFEYYSKSLYELSSVLSYNQFYPANQAG